MESYEFIVKSRKEDIDFINKIIEAYEGLGVVRTTNAKEGLLTIITTDNFKDDLRDVIVDLGKNYVVAEILEEGTKKCNNTKKAERFFKERGIKFQFIDMKEKGMSKGEFNSVAQVNGGLENMINWEGKDKDLLALIKYIADEDKLEKVLENPQVIKTPVVRNGKQSTLGYQPDVWKEWK